MEFSLTAQLGAQGGWELREVVWPSTFEFLHEALVFRPEPNSRVDPAATDVSRFKSVATSSSL
jgi:hypothetical protein